MEPPSLSHAFVFRHLYSPSVDTRGPDSDSLHHAACNSSLADDRHCQDSKDLSVLILLNTPANDSAFLKALWPAADMVVVADGAANRLLRCLGVADASSFVPNLICGDMDSLTDDTR